MSLRASLSLASSAAVAAEEEEESSRPPEGRGFTDKAAVDVGIRRSWSSINMQLAQEVSERMNLVGSR